MSQSEKISLRSKLSSFIYIDMTDMFGHINNQLCYYFYIYGIYCYTYYVSPCCLFSCPFFLRVLEHWSGQSTEFDLGKLVFFLVINFILIPL